MSQLVLSRSALKSNLALAREWAPEGSRMRAMVKANAYGHGIRELLPTFVESADELGVATLEEGLEIRSCLDVPIPIFVMSGERDWSNRSVLDAVRDAELVPVISSLDELRQFVDRAEVGQEIEIKLDTGMGRLGIQERELVELTEILGASPRVQVVGWLTHFAASDEQDLGSALEQERRFGSMLSRLPEASVESATVHSCNSGALMRRAIDHGGIGDASSLVRPGVMLYGAGPSRYLQDSAAGRLLQPIGRWATRVIAVRTLSPGHGVGYGSTWRVEGDSEVRVAVLPVGYADGYRRSLGGRSEVLIRGERFPVVGRVSMDLISVLVDDRISVGDEAVLLGEQKGDLGSDSISVWEWSDLCETIPYEIWTGLGSRVERVIDA